MSKLVEDILCGLIMLWPLFAVVAVTGVFVILDTICPSVHDFRIWIEGKMGVNEWDSEEDGDNEPFVF